MYAMAKTTGDWTDVIKLVRTALFEKRPFVVNDTAERNQVQKCLDVIQKSIKITSLTSMKERLEAITRQLGLKLKAGPTKKELFIFTDMFLVEIQLNPDNGQVEEVKIAHQSDPSVSCPEITEVLNNSDFIEFTKHLDELSSLYQLNADKKQKQKAYQALHALEKDLSELALLQSSINDPNNLVHKSPVGILEPRKGGHPMKLTYFISPYDLLDLKTKSSVPLTIDVVTKRKLGYSAAVCIESSSSHKIQTQSLISINKTAEGKSLPQFAALNNLNSASLPACFVLRLPKQLPMSLETLRKIHAITGIEVVSPEVLSHRVPLVNLIAKNLLPESELAHLTTYHGPYYVQLPDHCHSYFMNDSLGDLEGVEVSSIPFTHPTYVPQILIVLRQQVLFNVVICSCIRRVNYSTKMEPLIFEVTALSMSTINVSFEHPVEESLATTEFDLRDITNVKCKLHDPSSFTSLCTDEYATKVMQRCFSIPVTMRAIITKCQENAAALREHQQKQKTRVLQQRNQKDIFFNSMNGNGEKSEHNDLPPYLSQLNQYQNNLSASIDSDFLKKVHEEPTVKVASQHQQQQNYVAMMNQNYNPNSDVYDITPNPLTGAARPNSLPIGNGLQQSAQFNQPKLQQSMLQEQMRQRMAAQGAAGQQKNIQQQNRMNTQQQIQLQRNQIHLQPQQKQNAMLMSMLSDVPAANSSAMNAYNQTGQSVANAKPKTQRKRKNDGTKSPGSASGRSPKRKMSEDDISRDSSTPLNDLMESISENHGYPNRPSSNASTPGCDVNFSNSPRSLESLLTGPRSDPGISHNNVQNFNADIVNYQFVNSANRSSFSGPPPGPGPGPGQGMNLQNFSDAGNFDYNNFTAPSPSQQNNKVKRGIKRMKSAEECNENSPLLTNQVNEDGVNEPQMMIKSLQDLRQVNLVDSNGNAKMFTPSAAKSPRSGVKSPSGSVDGRRCVGGVDGVGFKRIGGNGFAGTLDGVNSLTLKKERKRRRADSVDSIKAMANASNILMPPPMITSTGELTSGNNTSATAYSFVDLSPNSNASQLPPITLNMKPIINNGAVNGPSLKARKSGMASPKAKLVDRSLNRSPKGLLTKGDSVDNNGNVQSISPKSSTKLGLQKANKISRADSSSSLKANKTQNFRLASSPISSANTGMTITKSSVNLPPSPPVSSSSSSSISSTPSSTNALKSPNSNNPRSLIAQKKRQASLSAVIDKLNRANNSTIGDGSPPIEIINIPDGVIAKSDSFINRPDSSSATGKFGPNTAVTSSMPNKINESKVKYTRNSDYTMKAHSGNVLKFTVTKTKLGAGETKSRKLLTNAGHKVSSNLMSAGPLKSAKGGSLGLKRQLAGSFKANQGFKASGVSSTSAGQINSPKGLNGPLGKGVSSIIGNRNSLGNKVSSSNAAMKQKITSTEVIESAIPRIRIDHLPKIPRTASSLANSNNNVAGTPLSVSSNVNNNNAPPFKDTGPHGNVISSNTSNNNNLAMSANMVNISSTTKFNQNSAPNMSLMGPSSFSGAPGQASQSSALSSNSLLSNNSYRKPTSNFRENLSSFPKPPMPTSSDRMGDMSAMKFQSCTISSSHTSHTVSSNHPTTMSITLTQGNAGNSVLLPSNSSTSSATSILSNTSTNASNFSLSGVTCSVTESEPKTSDSNNKVSNSSTFTGTVSGVSSSSDNNKLSTSTPSSPAECSIIPDVLQKPPPLIPTESIDEFKDNLVAELSSASPSSNAISPKSGPSSSFAASSSSDALISSCPAIEDDEDDEDGLIIDFPSTPTKKDTCVSSSGANNSAVYSEININSKSSNLSPTSAKHGQDLVQSSTSHDKDSSSTKNPSSSNFYLEVSYKPPSSSAEKTWSPPASTGTNAILVSTESNSNSSNNVIANSSVPSCSSNNPISESPSSQSISSLTSKRSPCTIDDDLMDEALVGSADF